MHPVRRDAIWSVEMLHYYEVLRRSSGRSQVVCDTVIPPTILWHRHMVEVVVELVALGHTQCRSRVAMYRMPCTAQ
jgi:hypothetical protein